MTRLLLTLHRLLRYALPARVRRLRGPEMDATFLRILQDARERRAGPLRVFVSEALDLIGARLLVRRNNASTRAREPGAGAERSRSSNRSPLEPRDRPRWLDALSSDLRFGLRCLRTNPGFTLAAVSTLAIGIGATATVLAVADAVLVQPLDYEEPDRVTILYEGTWPEASGASRPYYPSVRLANLLDWKESNEVFTDIAYLIAVEASLTGGAEPRYVYAHRVSANFFELLGVEAVVGRAFSARDVASDATPVAVLGHALWERVFGGDPSVVGRTVRIDGAALTVIGVLPRGFSFDNVTMGGTPDLWITAAPTPDERADRFTPGYLAVARLREGITIEQAQGQMDRIAAALAEEYPQANTDFRTGEASGVTVQGVHDDAVLQARRFILLSLAAAGLVLLIACINVGNLLLARSTARRKELSLRAALGAGRWRVVRQLLTESALLAALGGITGLAGVHLAIDWVLAWAPHAGGAGLLGGSIPLLERLDVDVRTLAMTAALCVTTLLLFGVAPALRATRAGASSFGHRPGSTSRGVFGRDLLVAAQIGMSLVLLIGAGLLGATFVRLYDVPVGFEPQDVMVMSAELPKGRHLVETGAVGTPRAIWEIRSSHADFTRDMVERLEATSAIDRAAVIDILPFRSARSGHSAPVHVEGATLGSSVIGGVPRTQDAEGRDHIAMLRVVTPGYFETMGIPLLGGRDFAWSDDPAAPGVAIVDEELAEWFWPGEPALGRRVQARVGNEWRPLEIVGVVGAVWQDGFSPAAINRETPPRQAAASRRRSRPGFLYLPYAQPATAYRSADVPFLTRVNVVVRLAGAPQEATMTLSQTLRSLEATAPVVRVESMEAAIASTVVDRRFHLLVLGGFASVALALALIGVYGVTSFHVGRRVHEIGVRLALGARRRGVVAAIVGDGLRVAMLGALMGISGALAGTRLLAAWLFGVSPTEPLVFAVLGTALVSVAVVACWIPARRAARVDPVHSLRAE